LDRTCRKGDWRRMGFATPVNILIVPVSFPLGSFGTFDDWTTNHGIWTSGFLYSRRTCLTQFSSSTPLIDIFNEIGFDRKEIMLESRNLQGSIMQKTNYWASNAQFVKLNSKSLAVLWTDVKSFLYDIKFPVKLLTLQNCVISNTNSWDHFFWDLT
jgi:hypothetical protein